MLEQQNTTAVSEDLVPQDVLHAFGATQRPVLLAGGQGGSFRSGDVVFKKTDDEDEYQWIAETLNELEQTEFKIPKYLKTDEGEWVRQGWTACEFVSGEHKRGCWDEKLRACEAFHEAVAGVPCPDFLSKRQTPWAIADRAVWGEQAVKHCSRLQELIDKLGCLLKPLGLPSQLIHGDFTGNVLFDEHMFPIIIDFSHYWRPRDFAKAIVVVDALVWEGADESILGLVKDVPEMDQLIIRAEMRRLIEIEECGKAFHRDLLDDVESHKPLVELICRNFC